MVRIWTGLYTIDILNEEIPRDIAMAEEPNIEIIDEKAPDGTLPDDHPDTNNGETLKEEMRNGGAI